MKYLSGDSDDETVAVFRFVMSQLGGMSVDQMISVLGNSFSASVAMAVPKLTNVEVEDAIRGLETVVRKALKVNFHAGSMMQ